MPYDEAKRLQFPQPRNRRVTFQAGPTIEDPSISGPYAIADLAERNRIRRFLESEDSPRQIQVDLHCPLAEHEQVLVEEGIRNSSETSAVLSWSLKFMADAKVSMWCHSSSGTLYHPRAPGSWGAPDGRQD